jgi:hypothetical protein
MLPSALAHSIGLVAAGGDHLPDNSSAAIAIGDSTANGPPMAIAKLGNFNVGRQPIRWKLPPSARKSQFPITGFNGSY